VSNRTGPSLFRLAAPPWLVGVVCVVIAVEIALAAGVLSSRARQPETPPAAADPAATTLTTKDESAIRALLVGRASAVQRRDRDAFLAGVDPNAADFRAKQAVVFDNLTHVPIGDWTYSTAPELAIQVPAAVARRYGDRVWGGEVQLRYSLAGYDQSPTVQRQYLTFVRRGNRWYVGGDQDLDAPGRATARNIWDFGPVTALNSEHTLALGHPGSRGLMAQALALVDRAVPRVTSVWSDWRQRVVVLVPANAKEAAALVPGAGELRQIAAVTSADLGAENGEPLGERVVINPGPFTALTDFGRQVVIQHEVTHVATRAVTSDATPYWLSEGFADYVGYTGQPVTPAGAARELTAEVRRGKVPDRLPGRSEFALDGQRLAQAYEASWLACRLIAERIGRPGLVRFYRAVSADPGAPEAAVDDGLRSVLGLTTEQFVALWRQYLRTQLAR
jgi:hypothetical protein